MLGTLRGRLLVILAVIGLAVWYLVSQGINLGLDLQGGMHLVLEVADPEGTMTPEARADATDRALRIIRTRIDEFGVEEPIIQKVGAERIIVELAGIRDEERAKEVIQQTAFLQFSLIDDGPEFRSALPRMDAAIVAAVGDDLPADAAAGGDRESVQSLLFGQRDTAQAAAAQDTAAGAAPSGAAARPLSAVLAERAPGEYLVSTDDTARVKRWLELPELQRVLPRGTVLRWGSDLVGQGAQLFRTLYVVESRAFMTGEYLEDAVAGRDPQYNETIVSFELSRRGGRIFERVTGENVGERIAIILDEEVYSAPEIRQRIGARGQIEMAGAPLQEAQDLALVLRAGALPAPLEILEERTVGPSLGADSISQGQVAGAVAVLLVVAMMIVYYRFAGFLSVIALGVYVLMILGGLAMIGANLTLPGIAGIILSVGMAVDANVLIFERIREELALGRTVSTAVDEGFRNAMSAIVDSNLTTLLTGLILFMFGTGPVQGFAVTLSIGIVASFFSAVFVTKTLFLIYLRRRPGLQALSI